MTIQIWVRYYELFIIIYYSTNYSVLLSVLSDEDPEPARPGVHEESCVSSAGGVLRSGDSWKHNACSSCVCRDGIVRCFSQQCPLAACRVPVLRKGQCCPQCMLGTCVCTDPAGIYHERERITIAQSRQKMLHLIIRINNLLKFFLLEFNV